MMGIHSDTYTGPASATELEADLIGLPGSSPDDGVSPGVGGLTPGGPAEPLDRHGHAGDLAVLMPGAVPAEPTGDDRASRQGRPAVVVAAREIRDAVHGPWAPQPRLAASLVPLIVGLVGVGFVTYLHQVVGSLPLAGLTGVMTLVAVLFCRVLLRP